MLGVVHRFQQRGTDQRLEHQKRQQLDTEGEHQRAPEHDGHGPGLQHFVMHAPEAAVLACHARLLDVERRARAAAGGTHEKTPERLAHAGTGRVVRRGHVLVMAAIVLGIEMPVGHRRKRDLGQPAFDGRVLVAQFVGGVDGHTGEHADGADKAQPLPEGQILGADDGTDGHEQNELNDHVDIGRVAVERVVLEDIEHPLGRIGAVLADQQVEHRHHAVDHDWPGKDQPGLARQPAGERQSGHDDDDAEAHGPQPALAVVGPRFGHCHCIHAISSL